MRGGRLVGVPGPARPRRRQATLQRAPDGGIVVPGVTCRQRRGQRPHQDSPGGSHISAAKASFFVLLSHRRAPNLVCPESCYAEEFLGVLVLKAL